MSKPSRMMTDRGNAAMRPLLALVGAAMLAGCSALGPLTDPRGVPQDAVAAIPVESPGERAMAALQRGDNANAEAYALAGLRRNPKDAYSLLVAGLSAQATGRYDLARQYYEVILTNRPQISVMVANETGVMQPKPIVDVAQANLEVVDRITGRRIARTIAESGRGGGADAGIGAMTDAETNLAGRFRILRRLLDEGLLTPDEYKARRAANMAALLPLSMPTPPAAAGLERPTPSDAQIVERLRAIAIAVEAREISPREQAEERTAILDALLPDKPRRTALAPLPPKDMLEAGGAIGRVERLRAANLISADEAAREKDALQRGLDGQLAVRPVEGTATGLRYGQNPANAAPPKVTSSALPAKPKVGAWGVALASAKSEEEAAATWDRIKAKFPEELGGKQLSVVKQDLGAKGQRWRVIAGPLTSQDAAKKLCKTLKLHRQSCDTAPFGQ